MMRGFVETDESDVDWCFLRSSTSVMFFYGLPGCPCLHFYRFSPSPFGPMGSLWRGAVVVRGHPGGIPGFPIEIWILGNNGCCVLVAGKHCPQRAVSLLSLFSSSLTYTWYASICSYFASTRPVADSYNNMLASS